ncbi:MAG: D-alanyl-D-alanine carboxypeptidase [Luminiphilus sp.]|nr:D-alanyl-D-alanine carboxypeptidase [Luminiphilus sp.]
MSQAIVPPPPKLPADAYFLIDANTGEVLVDHNGDLSLPPASLTKIMTSYVLAEEVQSGRASLGDVITVDEESWAQNPLFEGSSLMWIEPGKPVTLGELERGIVISSGNDASVAAAKALAGTTASFVDVMNQTAARLGLNDTVYRNPHGLPHPKHRTTAKDLAALSVALINDHPEHYKLYKEQRYTYNGIPTSNRNTLLRTDNSVDGLKTGYTSEAGYGLVASALRDDMRLVSVVLGSATRRTRASESSSLLNYGFRFFQTLRPLSGDVTLAEPRVWKAEADTFVAGALDSIALTVNRERTEVEIEVDVSERLEAPIARGDAVGIIRVVRGSELLFETDLVALEDVPSGSWLTRLIDALVLWFQGLLG